LTRQAVAAFRGLVGVGRGTDDHGLLAPRTPRQLAPENRGDVELDANCPAVAVVEGPVGAQLEGADVAESTPMLAARVRVEGPGEAHVLDRVERRLALHIEVDDVGEPRLHSTHMAMIAQTFGDDERASLMSDNGAKSMGSQG